MNLIRIGPRVILIVAAAAFAVFFADAAWAWGPGTHLKFAEIVFAHHSVLPAEVAWLIGRFPGLYYYGNIIADLILGKSWRIDYSEHSHNWEVAFRMLGRCQEPRLQAVLWGYLTHLAADVVAHNVFIPAETVHAAVGRGRGHAFWEMHYEAHVPGDLHQATARIQALGRDYADQFLMRELVETLFSHRTNRWLFSGSLVLQRLRAYRGFSQRSARLSPFRLEPGCVRFYDDLSLRAIADLLRHGANTALLRWDPTGHAAQSTARALRKQIRRGGPELHREAARRLFLNGLDALPPSPFEAG